MAEPTSDTTTALRSLAGTRLHLMATEMAGIHHGLVEANLLPDLQDKLRSWIKIAVDAHRELERTP